MSKIEKALQKARSERGTQIVVSPHGNAGRQIVPVEPTVVAPAHEPRVDATRQIARMREPQLRNKTDLEQSGIIHPEMQDTNAIKAFREIRTRIIQKTGGRNCTVLVTAIGAQSGASLVTLNLGVAFAFDAGKTAMIIDCNLRQPSLHKLVAAQSHKGIKDYIGDPEIDVGEIIHSVGIPRLRVVPAGENRGSSMEYFTSARMRQLLIDLKQRFHDRYILLDAPPMSQSADMQILTEMCDFVLLVVPYGKVTETQIARAVKSISEQKFLGVVFNNDPRLPRLDWKGIVRTSPLYRGTAALLAVFGKKRRRNA